MLGNSDDVTRDSGNSNYVTSIGWDNGNSDDLTSTL